MAPTLPPCSAVLPRLHCTSTRNPFCKLKVWTAFVVLLIPSLLRSPHGNVMGFLIPHTIITNRNYGITVSSNLLFQYNSPILFHHFSQRIHPSQLLKVNESPQIDLPSTLTPARATVLSSFPSNGTLSSSTASQWFKTRSKKNRHLKTFISLLGYKLLIQPASVTAATPAGTRLPIRSVRTLLGLYFLEAFRRTQLPSLLLVAWHTFHDAFISIFVISRTLIDRISYHLPRRSRIVTTLIGVVALARIRNIRRVRQRQARDATSEWSRYALHPVARSRAVLTLMIQVFPLWLLYKIPLFPLALRNRFESISGRLFANGLLKLGPLYVKLGQIVSCREQWLPPAWIQSLTRLQDEVPSRNGQEALDLAYAAWLGGRDHFHSVFSEFNTTPLAAASLGQVHVGTLAYSGAKVAIKLQRPYLQEIFDQDLALMIKIATWIDRYAGKLKELGGISQSWTEIFRDAVKILKREIDYRAEANHIDRFCREFGLSIHGEPASVAAASSRDGNPLESAAPWLRTPTVYSNLSSEKVLVMEYVPSIKINNREELIAANVTAADMEYLADMLARSYLRQFCCNRFFTTDPHPGNLGVEILDAQASLPQHRVRLVFYDFGQVATLTRNQADGILTIIEAIVDSDVDKSMEAFAQMGVLKTNTEADLVKVRAKIADNFRTGKVKANRKRMKKKGYVFNRDSKTISSSNRTSVSSGAASFSSAGSSAPASEIVQYFTLPAEYAFVGRALTQMDGVGKFLDPEFDFISSGAPWMYEIKGAVKYIREEATKVWSRIVKDLHLDHVVASYVQSESPVKRRFFGIDLK